VRDQHRTIKGADDQGRSYHALSPEAFYWAHATFFESMIAAQEIVGTPLGRAERERLYDESIGWYALYGLSMRPVPPDYAAFCDYWEHMLDQVLEPTEVALGSFAGAPGLPSPYPWLAGPAWAALRPLVDRGPAWIARGTLPPRARAALGLSWSPAEDRALRLLAAGVRTGWPLVPTPLRYLPRARAAFRREAGEQRAAA
jgi:uncharacterized protein (DUF2236 family)